MTNINIHLYNHHCHTPRPFYRVSFPSYGAYSNPFMSCYSSYSPYYSSFGNVYNSYHSGYRSFYTPSFYSYTPSFYSYTPSYCSYTPMYYNQCAGLFNSLYNFTYTLTSGIKSLFSKNKAAQKTSATSSTTSNPFYNPPIVPKISSGYIPKDTSVASASSSSTFYNPPIVPKISSKVTSTASSAAQSKAASSTTSSGTSSKSSSSAATSSAKSGNKTSGTATSGSSKTTSSSKSSVSTITSSSPEGVKLDRNNNKYGKRFLDKVKKISKNLNCNYRDLLAIMNAESGINASIKNPNGSATGLIQFLETTANGLGTTTDELAKMDPIKQLDYVEKYLSKAKSSAGFTSSEKLSGGDLYSLVFLPARAKQNILTQKGEAYYSANSATDLNGDGKITKDELTQRVKNFYVSDTSFLG